MSIRQRLEDVRQQRDQLAPVPGLNKDYAQSLLDANRLRELAGEEFEAYRQQLAVTVHEKTLARFKDLAQAKAKELGAERGIRDGLAKDLRQLEADYNNQGGNAISAIEQSLENARVGLKLRQQVEESARKALSDAGLELQWTAAGWEQAHEHAAARSAELKDDSEALKELRFEAFDGHATRKRELAAAQQELVSLKTRKSLLPPSSIENRSAIAAATGVPEEQMPFGGELIDLAEGQEQWRPAAERALRSLATTLLVPGEHFAAVTRYLNDHSVRGALRAVDVSKPLAGGALAVEDAADGDLLTKLDILTMGPSAEAGEWIRERIALDFAYPCVEDPDELARLDKGLSLGGVVKRNRHTVEKDDRFTGRQDYVLGFDNASKLELVAAQVEDLQQELAKAAELAQSREESHQGMTRQLEALRRVAEDHRPWEQVSAAVAADELARIEQRLKDALAAQADLEPLRANIEAARHKHQSSTEAAAVLQSEYKAVDSQLTDGRFAAGRRAGAPGAVAAVGGHRHGTGAVLPTSASATSGDARAGQPRQPGPDPAPRRAACGRITRAGHLGAAHPHFRGLRARVGNVDFRGPRHLDRRRRGVRSPLPRHCQRRAARAGGRIPAVLQPAHARILQHPAAPAGRGTPLHHQPHPAAQRDPVRGELP